MSLQKNYTQKNVIREEIRDKKAKRHSGTMTFFGEEVGEESDILIIILFKCSLHEVDLVVTLSFPIKVSKNPRI